MILLLLLHLYRLQHLCFRQAQPKKIQDIVIRIVFSERKEKEYLYIPET